MPEQDVATRQQRLIQRLTENPGVVESEVEATEGGDRLLHRRPHVGRGGWAWYTDSAGWLYRAALEDILGLRIRNGRLTVASCVPGEWARYEITYRYKFTVYQIEVENGGGGAVKSALLERRPGGERWGRVEGR